MSAALLLVCFGRWRYPATTVVLLAHTVADFSVEHLYQSLRPSPPRASARAGTRCWVTFFAAMSFFNCKPNFLTCRGCCKGDDEKEVSLAIGQDTGDASLVDGAEVVPGGLTPRAVLPARFLNSATGERQASADDPPGTPCFDEFSPNHKFAYVDRELVQIDAGTWYQGQWVGTHCHGQGFVTRSDGCTYEGTFFRGQAHGHGTFRGTNGNVYVGEWRQDRAHGRGLYTFADGTIYDGEWDNDEKCGSGIERWSDGSSYEGQFLNGAKHGHGMFKGSSDSVIYAGQFVADAMSGEGTYHFTNGRVYTGQWSKGAMDGEGVMDWPNGSKYKGFYRAHLRHGSGCFTWPDGRAYIGQWRDGKQDGDGVIREASGSEKKSRWSNGVEDVEYRKAEDIDGTADAFREGDVEENTIPRLSSQTEMSR
eukprot:TRINITY_DN17969_c0_g1_i1.p1 TRINITY_DN17969_c0_g1~~TRINITY_DN17969_c0_g1_i1.p1  ORF type:complete len:472 (-),score=54.48 TRINITY_DN17969_c0_g1_i1:52-1317(-)